MDHCIELKNAPRCVGETDVLVCGCGPCGPGGKRLRDVDVKQIQEAVANKKHNRTWYVPWARLNFFRRFLRLFRIY